MEDTTLSVLQNENFFKPLFIIKNHFGIAIKYGTKTWGEVKDDFFRYFNMPQNELAQKIQDMEMKKEKALALLEKVKSQKTSSYNNTSIKESFQRLKENRQRQYKLESIIKEIETAQGFYADMIKTKAESVATEHVDEFIKQHQLDTKKYEKQPLVEIFSTMISPFKVQITASWYGNSYDCLFAIYENDTFKINFFEEKP